MAQVVGITRRDMLKSAFIAGSGTLLSLMVGMPSSAKAEDEPIYMPNPEVDRLWAEALRRSAEESVDLSEYNEGISAQSFVSAYGTCPISALGETLALYASLEVASNNVITNIYGWNLTTLYGLYNVADTIPGGETILDSGRTRAIHFTVVLRTVTGQSVVRDGYAEIYYTGGVRLVV